MFRFNLAPAMAGASLTIQQAPQGTPSDLRAERRLRRSEARSRRAQWLAMTAEGRSHRGRGGPRQGHEPWPGDAPWESGGAGGRESGRRGAGRSGRGGRRWGDDDWTGGSRGPGRGGSRGRGSRGGPGWAGRGGRVRRGDVRAAILALLAEQPRHGYDLMQELAERTNGRWKPSPGSVYPTLAQLEDEGLIVAEEAGGKRVFTLTDAGRAEVAERGGPAPWDEVNEDADAAGRNAEWDFMREAALVMAAAKQFRHFATADQREAATKVLADARRHLYRLLSVDPDE